MCVQMSRFVLCVVQCAHSAALRTRRLAARALPPLVPPAMYIAHIEEMLTLLCDQNIKRNFCHGILLQVTRLLENKPDNLSVDEAATARLQHSILETSWILQQAGGRTPCHLIADEYTNMINLLVWKFPSLMNTITINKIIYYLDLMLKSKDILTLPGKDVCLANAANLFYVLTNKYKQTDEIIKLIYTCLSHYSYDVILTSLNYLLILNNDLEIEDAFQEHLTVLSKENNIINELKKDENYTKTLYKVLQRTKYLECKQKCLKLLSLEKNSYKYMIQDDVSDDDVIYSLTRLVTSEHENMTHIYLYSLTSFLTDKINEPQVKGNLILEAIRSIYDCSSSRNSLSTRNVVANFLERNFKSLINLELNDLSEEDKFELEARLWAGLVLVLEDDEAAVRGAGARTVGCAGGAGGVVCARAGQQLRALVRARARGAALLCVLALLDFNCEVCLPDYSLDEVRVFDQNEKYNVFVEETVWSVRCAGAVRALWGAGPGAGDACARAAHLAQLPHYARTFAELCGPHLDHFLRLAAGESSCDIPKVNLFVKALRK